MAEITAATVGRLREMTNAGMMDCKKALTEANGDINGAVDILRKKGAATAAAKATREAKEGIISQYIAPGGKLGVLVEVNCETDFVARNEMFKAFADDAAKRLASDPNANFEADAQAMVAKIRENIKVARHARMEVNGNGMIAAYIHTGAKVGVLVEVGAGKESTVANEEFKQLVKDITLQIAAGHPHAVSRIEVPQDVIAKEKEIAAEQVKNKPPQAIAKNRRRQAGEVLSNILPCRSGLREKEFRSLGQRARGCDRQAIGRRDSDSSVCAIPGRRKLSRVTVDLWPLRSAKLAMWAFN